MDPASLYGSPNALASHYSRFGVSERLLLTGHSHQAWPDCGFDGQTRAWLDAARYVDDKWEQAFAQAERVRAGFAGLLGDRRGCITLGANTHELVVRLLSALPLRERPRLVTTDGEFHSIRRQLDRLAEEGLVVVRVPEAPVESLATRLSQAVDDRTALVLVSAVFFDTGRIARGLGDVAASCRRHGTRMLVDAYHALNVVPFSLDDEGLGDAFVTGGGYKYCQLGEGNCFLRIPPDTELRPVVTGWFSEFTVLAERQRGASRLRAGRRPAGRRDIRSDQPLSRRPRLRLLPRARAYARAPAGGEPASDRAARVSVRRARSRSRDREPRPCLPARRNRWLSRAPLAGRGRAGARPPGAWAHDRCSR